MNQTTTYIYQDDGSLLKTIYPNQTSCAYNYDAGGRNIGHYWLKPNNTDTICSYQFTLDELGQHIVEQRNEPLGLPPLSELLVDYTYDTINRIKTADDTTFTFEDRGTALTKGANIQYSSDDYKRLTAFNSAGNHSTFTYDAVGNRRTATRNDQTTRFALDIVGMSQVLIEYDGNNVANYYVYGLGLINRIKPSSGGSRFYHYDYRGSTVAMTNESGDITHQYSYSPYGENWNVQEEDFNPYRYVGMHGVQYEEEQHYIMRARYYDATIGRFLSEDPVWGTNLYEYSGNNPITNIDPLGANYADANPAYFDYNSEQCVSKPIINRSEICMANRGGSSFKLNLGHTWIIHRNSRGEVNTYGLWSEGILSEDFRHRGNLYKNAEFYYFPEQVKCNEINFSREAEFNNYIDSQADVNYSISLRQWKKNVCSDFALKTWIRFTNEDIDIKGLITPKRLSKYIRNK